MMKGNRTRKKRTAGYAHITLAMMLAAVAAAGGIVARMMVRSR